MQYEYAHLLDANREAVEAALFEPQLVSALLKNVTYLKRVEPLEQAQTPEGRMRRMRYVPVTPMRLPGQSKMPPEWFAWIEEARLVSSAHRIEVSYTPCAPALARLFEHTAIIELQAEGADRTRRVIRGDIRPLVPGAGHVAARLVERAVRDLMAEEAAALNLYLRERG